VLLLVGAAACTDQPLAPVPAPEPVPTLTRVECTITVRTAEVSCQSSIPSPAGGPSFIVMGGQDRYVKLASSGASYDAGAQTFDLPVTVQNLLSTAIGTKDGSTATGVRVFFADSPTNGVSVANSDGTFFFTTAAQPYFFYNQLLIPYQISASKTWRFDVPSPVLSFTFTVYVDADRRDEDESLFDRLWSGVTSSAWELATNWAGGVVPDSATTVTILPAALTPPAPHQPVLATDADVLHLRVGFGSTLAPAANTLRVRGNLDAPGTITGGTAWMSGESALLAGNVHALRITGSAHLQGAVRATGAVSIADGSLALNGHPLSIQVP
jgi:hypothetical protein